MNCKTLISGFPRIGEHRELKKALERYWTGKIPLIDLEQTSSTLRKRHWRVQQERGIDLISCNDFSWYDSMLDTIVMLNAIPERFRLRMDGLPIEQLWVNPDCGLKTRAWEEVRLALRNMAQAVKRIRACV